MADGSAVASWIELAEQRAQFRIRRVESSGARSDAVTVSGLAGNRASGYPRIAMHGDELVLAWTETRPALRRAQGVPSLPRDETGEALRGQGATTEHTGRI